MIDSARSFNAIADDYKAHRPVYSLEFIESILAVLPQRDLSRICEIGCGTGQATIPLARLGYEITCVEPGDSLRAIAQESLGDNPKVTFIAETFEAAELQPESYDLVFASQSLHWVEAPVRFNKSCEILMPEGSLLAVWRWNLPLEGTLGCTLDEIFRHELPHYRSETREEYEQGVMNIFHDFVNSELFWSCQLRRIPYEWEKASQDYVSQISTWSQFACLASEKRAEVCSRVKKEIDRVGGKIRERGETVIMTGRKKIRG